MITPEELQELELTTNADEWNAACDKIKAARGGQYPPDWYAKVLASGLMAEAQDSWK